MGFCKRTDQVTLKGQVKIKDERKREYGKIKIPKRNQ